MENEGHLTESNILDIFNNLDFKDESKRNLFLQSVFEGREKIPIEEFLEKLDLEQAARRESIASIE
jgi:hypothetical protein